MTAMTMTRMMAHLMRGMMRRRGTIAGFRGGKKKYRRRGIAWHRRGLRMARSYGLGAGVAFAAVALYLTNCSSRSAVLSLFFAPACREMRWGEKCIILSSSASSGHHPPLESRDRSATGGGVWMCMLMGEKFELRRKIHFGRAAEAAGDDGSGLLLLVGSGGIDIDIDGLLLDVVDDDSSGLLLLLDVIASPADSRGNDLIPASQRPSPSAKVNLQD